MFSASSFVAGDGKSVTVVQCNDVLQLICWKLESLGDDIIFDEFTGEEIVISVGGDAGGGSTKISLLFGNTLQPNSVNNIVPIAIYTDVDNYDMIEKYLSPLLNQLNQITNVTYKENGIEKRRIVRWTVVGDFKFICELLGHKKQSATYYCPFCIVENPRGSQKATLETLNFHADFKRRTLGSYYEYSEKGEYGVKRGRKPLLKHVQLCNYLPGMLHCVTGVFQHYIFWPIWIEAARRDNTTSFVITQDKHHTLRMADQVVDEAEKELEKSLQERKELLVYDRIVRSKSIKSRRIRCN